MDFKRAPRGDAASNAAKQRAADRKALRTCYLSFPDYSWSRNEGRTALVWRGHHLNLPRKCPHASDEKTSSTAFFVLGRGASSGCPTAIALLRFLWVWTSARTPERMISFSPRGSLTCEGPRPIWFQFEELGLGKQVNRCRKTAGARSMPPCKDLAFPVKRAGGTFASTPARVACGHD